MNFKFNRKPLKEKIYKWYVCGYYDINARDVEDNLTTNDVEEAKDFAWELVNRGDFVIVKNMHNGKSAIINEDDAFDDVNEYLNDIFRSIDGRTDGRTGSFKEGKASPSKSKESAKVRELIDTIEAPHGLAKINGYRLLPDKLDIINGGQFKITKAQYNRLKELGYGTDESYRRRVK